MPYVVWRPAKQCQRKEILKIAVLGERLTQRINGGRGSYLWAPETRQGLLPLRNPWLGESFAITCQLKSDQTSSQNSECRYVVWFFTLNAMSLSILYIFIMKYTSALASCFIFRGNSGNWNFSPLVKVCDQSNPLLGTFRLISALIGWAESRIFRVRMAFSPSAIIEHVIVRQSSVTVHCMLSSGSVTGKGHFLWSRWGRCERSWSPWWSPLRWWPPPPLART